MAAKDPKDPKDAKAKEKAARAREKEREAKRSAAEKEKEKAAKVKEKEKAAKRKEQEKASKAKEKEREAKRKEKEREAKRKEKEREARAKERQREARDKEKAREEKAKQRRDKEKAARAKEKEREQKAKDKQREARRKEKEREARFAEKHPARHRQAHSDEPVEAGEDAGSGAADAGEVTVGEQPVQPAEQVAVPERGETTDVEDAPATSDTDSDTADSDTDSAADGSDSDGTALAPLPDLDVPDNDNTVRPKGYLAEALGKEDAVTRSTQRATLAASYTTRDHDLIRAWAQTRAGRPADVVGTGNGGGAGVLRIEFPDGPGDDSRLEDVDWGPFFRTFDESDVDFLYQERVRTGDVSRFHKIVRADS